MPSVFHPEAGNCVHGVSYIIRFLRCVGVLTPGLHIPNGSSYGRNGRFAGGFPRPIRLMGFYLRLLIRIVHQEIYLLRTAA
jgi:hypothetical protein